MEVRSERDILLFAQAVLSKATFYSYPTEKSWGDTRYAITQFKKQYPNGILIPKNSTTDTLNIPEYTPPEYYTSENPVTKKTDYRLTTEQKTILSSLLGQLEEINGWREEWQLLEKIEKIIPSLHIYRRGNTYRTINSEAPEHPETTWTLEDFRNLCIQETVAETANQISPNEKISDPLATAILAVLTKHFPSQAIPTDLIDDLLTTLNS